MSGNTDMKYGAFLRDLKLPASVGCKSKISLKLTWVAPVILEEREIKIYHRAFICQALLYHLCLIAICEVFYLLKAYVSAYRLIKIISSSLWNM